MSSNPPPAFARDYIRSAQVASLGYIASIIKVKPLQINATGTVLADYISRTDAFANFTPDELTAFTNTHEFIGSTSRGPGAAGGDAIAFRNISTGTIIVGVAGINDNKLPWKDGLQTDSQTALTGANGAMYADVRSFLFGLMSAYPTSKFDLNGHSAGGQMVQLARAEAAILGLGSRIETTNTFGSFGINFNHLLDNGFEPELSSIIRITVTGASSPELFLL